MNGTTRKPLLVLHSLLLMFGGFGLGILATRLVPQAATPGAGVAYAATLVMDQDAPTAPNGTGFTYQGRLTNGGNPVNTNHDLRFTLYDDPTVGSVVGGPITVTNQLVTDGLFTVVLDFGANAFQGDARWMLIEVQPTGGGGFTALTPRQVITPAPYALSAPWSGISGKPEVRPPFARSTLDSTGNVGQHTSITIGADGFGLISYYDGFNQDLKVAHCSNALCSAATITTLDSTSNVGSYTSITIGADGLGLISYYDTTNADLKVAHCSNTLCSAATITTLDTGGAGSVGEYTSITIGVDGLGLISYYDPTNLDLKVAHCSNTLCSAATTYTLDSTANVGEYTSITIGADGLGLISYYEQNNADLKVAHCSNTLCSAATTYTLDSTSSVGRYTSITIGADGFGLISYYDGFNQDLKVAHCSNTLCSAATNTFLDSTGSNGQHTSITIGADGLGLISYFDSFNTDLRVAHCSNGLCLPYHRER